MPVGIVKTVTSTSFLNVISETAPWPVKIKPSSLVWPIAALSPEDVSPVGSIVDPVITPEAVMLV